MEVFREEKSRCVLAGSKSVSDRLLILWQESRTFRIITCTGSKSTPYIILNIVFIIF